MRHPSRCVVALRVVGLALLASLLPGCGPRHEYVAGDSEKFPRIRFVDSTVSLNDRCPVTRSKLNRKMDPLYVNGQPIGFC